MTENQIENVVWKNVSKLGYSSAYAIRNARIGPEQGQVDLALFPRNGKKQIILVEVKRAKAEEAKCKVVGQLIMYLTGALQLSQEGVKLYRDYARKSETREKALSRAKTSPMQITGAKSVKEAWEVLTSGDRIERDKIALYIATDGPPRGQVDRSVELLAKHYKLPIGLIQVTGKTMEVVRECP